MRATMAPYKLEYVEAGSAPVAYLASFPSGVPGGDCFNPGSDECIRVQAFANTSRRKAHQRIVVGENDTMEYVGRNFGPDSMHDRTCKYLLGVIDDKSKTVHLHDVPAFALKPRVKRARYNEMDEDNDTEDTRTEYQKAIAAKTTLVESFGARRNLQAIQSAQRNRVDEEAISGVSSAIASRLNEHASNVPSLQDTQNEMDADRAIPPCDLNATEPADVYKYNDLITVQEVNVLKQQSKSFTKASKQDIENWRVKKWYGEYVLSHVEQLPSNANAKNKAACALLYIAYLQKLLRSERQLNKEDHGMKDVPINIRNRLLELFTQRAEGDKGAVVYKMTDKLKDKAVAYVLAIALHVDGFSIELDKLAHDLKLTQTKLKTIARELGLKLDKAGKFAKLTTPFELPKANIRTKLS